MNASISQAGDRQRAAIILAAGRGTRMKSVHPKVLHEVGGRSLLAWSIALAEQLDCARTLVVVSGESEALTAAARAAVGAENIFIQEKPRGTGDAVRAAQRALEGFDGSVVILYADTPLVTRHSVEKAFAALDRGASVAVLGFCTDRPAAYGRLIIGPDESLQEIVEARDATSGQLAVNMCNSGVMAAPWPLLSRWLDALEPANVSGEYYLTDVVGIACAEGCSAAAEIAPQAEVLGVNCTMDLVAAEAAFQSGARARAIEAGVTLLAPETVFLSWDTAFRTDVVVEPHVVFGPGVRIGQDVRIRAFSHLEGADIGARCVIGPFARLRPAASIGQGTRIGNFVEVKNARLGEHVRAGHLSYIGDADVGDHCNIGAGTVFCNYDGSSKHHISVGSDAFIGSNTALVAPVTIGENAYVGSGSVIVRDVGADALALGRSRQVEKSGWTARRRSPPGKD